MGYKLLVTDFSTADGEGKKRKRGMGDKRGEGEGEREVEAGRGRDFMDWSWGRSGAFLDGRVCVLGSCDRLGRAAVLPLPALVAATTSGSLKVKTGL